MKKTIFITGAASGIGRAAALLFARQGWFVGLTDVDAAKLAELRGQIGEASCWTHVLDVTDLAAFRVAVEGFEQASGGRMDVLYNNAGLLEMGRFLDLPPERVHRMMEVNMRGVVNGIYAALPLLERTGGATILSMGSASGVYGVPELAVYSATKFFVRGLTEGLDLELKARGVRVVDIMPGYVDTPMVQNQKSPATSVKRLGVRLTAEDIAQVAWEAATSGGRPVHVIPQLDIQLFKRLGGLLPGVGRLLMGGFSGFGR